MSQDPLDIDIHCDKERMDFDKVYAYISTSYWAEGIARETFDRSVAFSLCFGAFANGEQIGFARVITDYATFCYLADVFVDPLYRKRGIASRMLQTIHAHPQLQGMRRWALVTKDQHRWYEAFGYIPVTDGFFMERKMEQGE